MTAATLPSRHLIRIGGKDAGEFLHSLITTDVDSLPQGEARPGALLTPQGKILFDFILWREGDGFLMETDAGQRDGLIRRLTAVLGRRFRQWLGHRCGLCQSGRDADPFAGWGY
jgi:folate-binding Fe-S cluster repair protein YgfZ